MPFDPTKPFTIEAQPASTSLQPAKLDTGTAAPKKFDPSKPFTIETSSGDAPPDRRSAPEPTPEFPLTYDMGGGVALPIPPEQPSISSHFAAGLVDPLVGGAQVLAHSFPPSLAAVVSDAITGDAGKRASAVDRGVSKLEQGLATNGTDWWRLAGNVASPINYFLPESIFGKGNILARAGSAAAQGAAVGALQPTSGKPESFGKEKAIQAGLGAAAGGVLAPITEAAGALGRWLFGTKGPEAVQDKAVQAVLKRIEQDQKAGGPTTQDMLDLIHAVPGKPMTLADVGGENLQSLLGRIQREPGEARQIITKFMTDRDLDAGLRLAEDVNKGIGEGSAHDTALALGQARSKAARPKYEAAFSRIVTTPEEAERVGRFIHDPIGQDALQRGLRVIQLENLAEDVPFNPADYGVIKGEDGRFALTDGVPNLRLMDAVKRGYDQIVEGFRNPVTGRLELDQYGRAVNLVRGTYTGELRSMYPRYGAALDAWGGPSASIDALQAGRDFAKQEPEAIARRVAGLSENDKEFYKLGAAATLRKMIATTGPAGDESRRIVGNAYTRAQLRPLFDSDEAYSRFIDSVKAEQKMFQTKFKTMGGSQTAARVAEDEGPDIGAGMHGLRGAMDLTHGNVLGAGYHAGRLFDRLRPKGDPAVNASVAKMLLGSPEAAVSALGVGAQRPPPFAQRATPFVVPGAAVGAYDALGIKPP